MNWQDFWWIVFWIAAIYLVCVVLTNANRKAQLSASVSL